MSNEKITISKNCPTCEELDKYKEDVRGISSQRGGEVWQEYNNLSNRINELKNKCVQCGGTGRIEVTIGLDTFVDFIKGKKPKNKTNMWVDKDNFEIVTNFNPSYTTINHMAAIIDVFIGDIGQLKRQVEELENFKKSQIQDVSYGA